MGLFKKPNRKFRQREARTDSEDENGTSESTENKTSPKLEAKASTSVDAVSIPLIGATSSKEKEDGNESLPKAPKLLSFHDEEDGNSNFSLSINVTHRRRYNKE